MAEPPTPHAARRDANLWVQIAGIAVLPLEALAVLLILAAADPGPLPALERLLLWTLGSLGMVALTWRLPVDPWSFLLVRLAPALRSDEQCRLLALQEDVSLRAWIAATALPVLALVVWLDGVAAIAWQITPLEGVSRFTVLLLAALLLALMQWQLIQAITAIGLMLRSHAAVDAAEPMGLQELWDQRLGFGLGLPRLLGELNLAPPAGPAASAPGHAPAVEADSEADSRAEDIPTVTDRDSTLSTDAVTLSAGSASLDPDGTEASADGNIDGMADQLASGGTAAAMEAAAQDPTPEDGEWEDISTVDGDALEVLADRDDAGGQAMDPESRG
ncbi:MAG: low-complexity tail membrane protein [Aphanocapsa feldmannii 277cV]|uniref:Low-complexity tail membrane protein n=2 Tax=Aphanocapsa feldmannii TaxID=192050 RepID=A0A524RN04_9CHRO|nr:MAG: low-complexity tail membrane protein [Aphanocapsa feldmannii 277cV]TGH19532.1 MAG: low-complexity tail membrane protein [Aphanocapsa feldmannii 277cI]